ncbi:MAG: AAA family ATPase, partial [Ferruginibacter sp.]|nr:AAA family ATPase [Ferruginibacter sp.]
MIVEFSVKNFRSIKDLQTISFVATGLKSSDENFQIDNDNICIEDGQNLLKTIGIYGANGSGKSNIIKALEYFFQAIKNEASSESNLKALCDPFLFQENSHLSESYFQIVLVVENKKYRYGFTVKKNPELGNPEKASNEVISSEWLYGTKEKKSGEYFIRNAMVITKEKLPNQEKVPPVPYEHSLFLTHAAAFDKDGVCASLRKFIIGFTLSNLKDSFDTFRWNSLMLLERENRKNDLLDLLSSFNLNYEDIIIERDKNQPREQILSQDKIFFLKQFVNQNNERIDIKLNLSLNESA